MLKILPVLTIMLDLNLFPPGKTPYFITCDKQDRFFLFENNFLRKRFVSLAILFGFFTNYLFLAEGFLLSLTLNPFISFNFLRNSS